MSELRITVQFFVMSYCFRLVITALFFFVVSMANGQTGGQKKQVSSVDVNRSKNQVLVTYTDGSSETMSEQDANKKGLVHNGGYMNSKDSGYKRIPGQLQSGNAKPLVIVDGKETSNDTLSKINPDKIESMNVLKGKTATDKYGVKGKNGVVEIITKQPVSKFRED